MVTVMFLSGLAIWFVCACVEGCRQEHGAQYKLLPGQEKDVL